MEQVHALSDQDCIDPRALRKAEDDALAKRVAEESGPVITRKPTPVECVRLGLALDKAQIMRPKDLIKEDAAYLISKGVRPCDIGKVYGFTDTKKVFNLLGNKWGLKKAKDVPEYPLVSVTVVKESVKPVQLTEAEKEDLFGNQPDHPRLIPVTENQKTYQKAIDKMAETLIHGDATGIPTPRGIYNDPADFEECEPKLKHSGESWVRVSIKEAGHRGGSLAFSSTVWKRFSEIRFNLEVNKCGDTIRLTITPNGKYQARGENRHVAAGTLTDKLQERGVSLPARFMIEQQGEYWIGRLENA